MHKTTSVVSNLARGVFAAALLLCACRAWPPAGAAAPNIAPVTSITDAQWLHFFVGSLGSRQVQTNERPRLHVCDTLAARLFRLPAIGERIRPFVDSISFASTSDCTTPSSRNVRTILVLRELHHDSAAAWANLHTQTYGGSWDETWRAAILGTKFFIPWTISMSIFTPS